MMCIVATLLLGNSVYSQCSSGACDKLLKSYVSNIDKERKISRRLVKSGKRKRIRLVKDLYRINESSYKIYGDYAKCMYGDMPKVYSKLMEDKEETYLFKKSLIKEIEEIVKNQ